MVFPCVLTFSQSASHQIAVFFGQKCFYCCSILPRGIDAGGHPGNFDPRKRGTITKNERILQELSAKIRHASTCGSREFVTSSYHDILHRNWIYVWELGIVSIFYGAELEAKDSTRFKSWLWG